MNLDNSIGAEDKMLVMIRKIEIINCYLFTCKNVKVCLMKMGGLIFVTMWNFLLGLIIDLYMSTLTVCWFNRMKQD